MVCTVPLVLSLPRSDAPVIHNVHCSSAWKRSVKKNPWLITPSRRWLAAHREPASALVRRVESLPVHAQTHGGESGHFNLFARHPPPSEVTEKTPKRVIRSHRRNHLGMLQQSHASRRDGCSHASRSAVCLRNQRVSASKCVFCFVLLNQHWGIAGQGF